MASTKPPILQRRKWLSRDGGAHTELQRTQNCLMPKSMLFPHVWRSPSLLLLKKYWFRAKSLHNSVIENLPSICEVPSSNPNTKTFFFKNLNCQAPAAHACNPSYSGGRDQEDHGSKPAWANSFWDPTSKKPITHTHKKGWWSDSRCRPWVQTQYRQK
jgi:hypothetical protein